MSIIEVKKRNPRIIFSALYVEYANEYAANEEKYAGYNIKNIESAFVWFGIFMSKKGLKCRGPPPPIRELVNHA